MMKKISWKGFRLPTTGQKQRQRSGSTSASSSTLSSSNNSGGNVRVSHSQSSSQLPVIGSSRDNSSTDLYLSTSGSCIELQQVEENRLKKKRLPLTSKKLSPSSSVTCSVSHHCSNSTPAALTPATANSISSSSSSCSSTSSSTPATAALVPTLVTRRSPDMSHHSSSSTTSTNTSSSVSSRHSASSSSCCPPHGNGGSSSPTSAQSHYQIGLLSSQQHHAYNEEDNLLVEQVVVPPTKQRKEKKNLLRNLRHCFTPTHSRKVGGNHGNKTLGLHNNSSSSGLSSLPISRKVSEHIDDCQSAPDLKVEGCKTGHRSLTNIRDSSRNSNTDCCNIQSATLQKLNEMHLHPDAENALCDGCKTDIYRGKDRSIFQKKLLEDYIGNTSGIGGDNGGGSSSSQSGSSGQCSSLPGPGRTDNNNVDTNQLPHNCEQLALTLNDRSPTVACDQWPRNNSLLYETCNDPTGSCGNLMPRYDPARLESPKVWSLTEELFRLSKFGWYWGPITRLEAEEKLLNKPDGAFLVRDSSDERYLLSLSFRSYGKTLHTRIEHCNGMFSFYAQPDTEGYPSIVDLIEHSMSDSVQTGIFCYYRSRSPGAPSFPVRLTKPVSRFTQVRTLQYLCRFVIRQYIRFDHIQQLPLPNSIKGWIEENQY